MATYHHEETRTPGTPSASEIARELERHKHIGIVDGGRYACVCGDLVDDGSSILKEMVQSHHSEVIREMILEAQHAAWVNGAVTAHDKPYKAWLSGDLLRKESPYHGV